MGLKGALFEKDFLKTNFEKELLERSLSEGTLARRGLVSQVGRRIPSIGRSVVTSQQERSAGPDAESDVTSNQDLSDDLENGTYVNPPEAEMVRTRALFPNSLIPIHRRP